MTLPRLRTLLFALPFVGVAGLEAQPVASLLRPVEADTVRATRTAPPGRGMRIPRSRAVEVNHDAFLAPVSGPRRIALELFPDTQFMVDERRSYWSADGSTFLWVGQIDGMSRGQVILAATGDVVSANVTTDGNDYYWIRQVDGRIHAVEQVEPQDDMLHDEVVRPPVQMQPDAIADDSRHRSPERLATTSRDAAATVIDLMVCYTTKAKNAAGGESGILNKIQLSVAETNQGYTNSLVNIQLNLVHTCEVSYDETANSISQALSDLRGTSDTKMDEIHGLRTAYGADLVALYIDKVGSAGGTVGIGYLMDNPSTSFASWAFSVNEQYWAAGPGWTLAHELGHNMGSEHDRANASGEGAYSYSYGYQRTTSPTFRTLMAYACSGVSCPRILYFSNPAVNYSGAPTGIASNQANSADNGTSLNNTAAIVAAFRATSSGCTYNVNPTSTSAPAGGGTGSITVSAGSGCTWTAQTSSGFLSITSGSSGSGNGSVSYSVQSNSGAARSGTMIVAGQTVTINQSAASCSYTLTPGSATIAAAGASTSVAVTAGSGCSWNASTGTGWINITSGSSGTGNGTVNYTVSSNSGAARNGSMTIAGQTFTVSQNAGVSTVSISFASSPSGLTLTIDGSPVVTPYSANWQVGTSHSVDAPVQGSGSTRYAFQSWSQGGSASQNITAPSSQATYTATFTTQYLLTANSTPSGSGGLSFSPAYGDGYYNSGVPVQVTATANPGYTFSNWTGSVSGSTSPVTVTMSGPRTVTANFTSAATAVTIATVPSGRTITVDNVSYTSPQTFNWQPGTNHTIAAATQGTGTRYSFSSWAHGGAAAQTITTPASAVTYTASFQTQYLLSGSVSPASSGSVSFSPPSGDGYYDAGVSVQASASANAGYQFSNWTGAVTGSTSPVSIPMNAQKSVTANFTTSTVPITINSNPPGLAITVDGTGYFAPQTFNWQPGTNHTLGAATQGTGTRYSFFTWSQGGAANQTISAPAAATTYTVTFRTEYLLTTSATPVGNGSVTVAPPSADGYYTADALVQLTAGASAGYQFAGWTGSATGTTNPLSLTMNASKNISASFSPASNNVTINTSPSGLAIVADGVQYTAPRSFQWATGSTHTIGVVTPQQGAGTRYTFANWSDGLGASHNVTVPAGSTTYTASFNVSHLLTTSAAPSGGGTVSISPGSGDGYYPAGTPVQLTAAPSTGFLFSNWTGDLTGSQVSASIAMNAPRSVAANFSAVATCSYLLSPSTASVLASGDIREVSVSTGGSCAWTAASTATWITILSGGSGPGNGTVRFAVAANSSSATRTGTVLIGGVTHTVTQSGANCSYTLSGPGGTQSSAGGPAQISVTTQSGCVWSASTTTPWLALAGSASGTGSGSVSVTVAPNTGTAARSGAVVIGGQWIHLMQRGTSSAATFNDVASSYLFFDYIGLLGLNGISQGCGGGAYCPESVMTRAEMAAFIIRALHGESFAYNPTPYFTDAPATHSHFKYIQKMKELGITVGCSATAYCPNDAVTRGQMAVFLVRARLGITNLETFPSPQTPYFDDIPSGHVFFPFIQKMKELGITAGCSATGYCSDSPNTRGQMAVFIVRSFF